MPPLDEIRAAFLRKPWKRCKNASEEVIPPFAVMRISNSTDDNGEILLTVDKPDTTFLTEYVVNGPWAIGAGTSDEGLCTDLAEAGFVLLDTGTPQVGEGWGPKPGEWGLIRYRYGFTIKGAEYEFGDYTAVVARQHQVLHFYGQTDGAINKGSTSGTVSVFDGNNTDTTMNVTGVINRFANVAITKKVGITIYGGNLHLTSAEC